MGNDCTKDCTGRLDSNPSKSNCFGCLKTIDPKQTEIDYGELETHNRELVPKGKLSAMSIGYLKSDEISFLRACAGKNLSAIRYYIKGGMNVNLLDEDRTSPLHIAGRSGSLQVIEELINHGAMLNIADIAGWTPLHVAAYYARSLVCHLLLKKGANPYHTNRLGETCWDLVKDKQCEEIFMVHFDRAELNRMTKKEQENPPAECLTEYHREREKLESTAKFFVARSLNENDFKETVNNHKRNLNLNGSVLNSDIKKTPSRTSLQYSGSKPRNLNKGSFRSPSNNRDLQQARSPKKEAPIIEKEKALLPKKHKYYLYFKNMKLNATKSFREKNDVLHTLDSDEDEEDEDGPSAHLSNITSINNSNMNALTPNINRGKFNIPKSDDFDVLEDPSSHIPNSENKENTASKYRHKKNGSRSHNKSGNLSRLYNPAARNLSNHSLNSNVGHNLSASLMLIQPNISISYLVLKNPQEVNFLELNRTEKGEANTIVETAGFKVDPIYNDTIMKIGIELFNNNSLDGLAFLSLFNQLKLNTREVAEFLFNEELQASLKKNKPEISEFLANFQVRESQDILDHFASFLNFEGSSFIDSLKLYLSKMVLINDPEKIDWILRGFAKRYYKVAKKDSTKALKDFDKSFQTMEAVRMLAFATVMLNIDIHYSESTDLSAEKIKELRSEFHSNLSGLNDGESFNYNYINSIFECVKKTKIAVVVDKMTHKKSKVFSFRAVQITTKALRASSKNKSVTKQYMLCFFATACLIFRCEEGEYKPKCVFLLKGNNVKISKGQFSVTPGSEKQWFTIGKFKENCLVMTSKKSLSFNFANVDDTPRIEAFLKTI